MTVAELIEVLEDCDQDAQVNILMPMIDESTKVKKDMNYGAYPLENILAKSDGNIILDCFEHGDETH